jgi:hypothetical protein
MNTSILPRLAFSVVLGVSAAPGFAANEIIYADSLAAAWSNWSWDTTYSDDMAFKKTGTASAFVNIAKAWGGFSLHRDTGALNLNTLSAIVFDVNPGAADNVAKVGAINIAVENLGNAIGQQATLSNYANPPLAANAWSTVTVPISAVQGGLSSFVRLDVQEGTGLGGVTFHLDNLQLLPTATAGCGALAVDSGAANGGLSLNGYLNDQYRWYDSACKLRTAALARNDTHKGGNAKQFTYVLPNGSTRTVNPGANGAGGFGYIVAHLSNPTLPQAYGKHNDSPLGSGDSAAYKKLFAGKHHAIHEYTLNYIRYGLTQEAITHHSIEPWTTIKGPNDPNRQYVAIYNMPVRVQWLFATGRNYPLWSVTYDLSAAPDTAVNSDFRAPYGDMLIDGGNGSAIVGGVGWGDKYQFASLGKPFTMDNNWDYSKVNNGAPYDYLWTSGVDAEMGIVGTQIAARQNAGGYNNFQAPNWRGHTSANMGKICSNDGGAGPAYDHKMPCTSDWAYQLIQYSVSSAAETTNNKRLAWGADWGSLGDSSFVSVNGYTVSGWPKVSYSTYIVLDPHSGNPTQTLAQQAKTISLTKLTAAIGKVRTSGIAGIGRTEKQSYKPAGYSPVYGTWEVDAANNNASLSFAIANSAPTALNNPILIIHSYNKGALPTTVKLDGVALTADQDYFASLRKPQTELWLTLNKNLSGTHTLEILN